MVVCALLMGLFPVTTLTLFNNCRNTPFIYLIGACTP